MVTLPYKSYYIKMLMLKLLLNIPEQLNIACQVIEGRVKDPFIRNW